MHETEYRLIDGSDAGSRAVEELNQFRERLPEIGANAAYLLERTGLLDRQAESGNSSGNSGSVGDALHEAAKDEDALRSHPQQ